MEEGAMSHLFNTFTEPDASVPLAPNLPSRRPSHPFRRPTLLLSKRMGSLFFGCFMLPPPHTMTCRLAQSDFRCFPNP